MSDTKLPRNVRVLGWASLLNDIASEMVFPLLPIFLLGIGGTVRHLGLIEGVAELVASVLKLATGAASDRAGRIGRKPFVVLGYVLTAVARAALGLVSGPWQVFGLRLADRFGKGIRTAPRDALLADATTDANRGRAFGFHRAMDHLGAAIGPLLAFVFLKTWPDQYRTLFLTSLLPGIAVVLLLLWGLRETPRAAVEPTFEPTFEPAAEPVGRWSRSFWLYLLASGLFALGCVSESFLLVRAKQLGVAVVWLPLLWCVFHILKSTGNWLLGRWVNAATARRLLGASWLLGAAIYALFAIATAAWQAWALFSIYALFCALKEPAEKTLVVTLAGPERKGLAFGAFHLTLGVAGLPAGLLFGYLYDAIDARAAFLTGAVAMLGAVAVLAEVRASKPDASARG